MSHDTSSPAPEWAGSEERLAVLGLAPAVLERGRSTLAEMQSAGMPAPYLYEFDGDLVIEWDATGSPTITVTATDTEVVILFPDYPSLAAYIKGVS